MRVEGAAPVESPHIAGSVRGATTSAPEGLSTAEAARRLVATGPNALPDTTLHPLVQAAKKFWAPVPWMLEAAMVLELVLRDFTEAAVIAGVDALQGYAIQRPMPLADALAWCRSAAAAKWSVADPLVLEAIR